MSKMSKENEVFKVKMHTLLPTLHLYCFLPPYSLKMTLLFWMHLNPTTTASLPTPPDLLIIC